MANKMIKGVAGLVVLALIYTGGSWYLGKKSQDELEKQVGLFNDQLKAMKYDVRIKVKNYDRGVFTSHGSVSLSKEAKEDDGVVLDFSSIHGPILWSDWSLGFSSYDISLQDNPNLKEVMDLFKGQKPTLHSDFGFWGVNQTFNVPVVEYADSTNAFSLKDGVIKAYGNYDHNKFDVDVKVPYAQIKTLTNEKSEISFKDYDLKLEGNYKDQKTYHYKLTASNALEEIFAPEVNGKISLHNLHSEASIDSQDGVGDVVGNSQVEKIVAFDKELFPTIMGHLKLSHINTAPLPTAYHEFVGFMMAKQAGMLNDPLLADIAQDQVLAQLRTTLAQTLRDDSVIEYTPFTVTKDGKKVGADLKLTVHADQVPQFVEEMNKSPLKRDDSYDPITPVKEAEGNVFVNTDVLNTFLTTVLDMAGSVAHYPVTPAQKEAIPHITQEVLDVLVANKFAVKHNNDYVLNIKVNHPNAIEAESYQLNGGTAMPREVIGMTLQMQGMKTAQELEQIYQKYQPLFIH